MEQTRLRIVSDLHLERIDLSEDGKVLPRLPKDHKSILIVAGDLLPVKRLSRISAILEDWSQRFRHVLFVPGNHEHYGMNLSDSMMSLRWLKDDSSEMENVIVLNPGKIEIDGVTFIGSTLWSDLDRNSFAARQAVTAKTMDGSRTVLADYCAIYKHDDVPITPDVTMSLHWKDRDFIFQEVDQCKEGQKIVVITHHLPSYSSVHPMYLHDTVTPSFASELGWEIQDRDILLWVHGHTHSSCDYDINGTRILCNPKGYGDENHEFNNRLTVDI